MAHFLRLENNVNFTKTCFLSKTACACVNMYKYINVSHNCLLYGTIHLYSNTVIERLKHLVSENIRKV